MLPTLELFVGFIEDFYSKTKNPIPSGDIEISAFKSIFYQSSQLDTIDDLQRL